MLVMRPKACPKRSRMCMMRERSLAVDLRNIITSSA
uniref:Uncharacterized protein n=1 Tax=Arundo donax TaxID=35708 RepID=A0A0A8YPF7_ARUDO